MNSVLRLKEYLRQIKITEYLISSCFVFHWLTQDASNAGDGEHASVADQLVQRLSDEQKEQGIGDLKRQNFLYFSLQIHPLWYEKIPQLIVRV